VRICLMIEGQEGVTWNQWLALAETCDHAGLDGLFRSDHYTGFLSGQGSLDAWATLAALAAVTERIQLGTLVSPATFRHPSVLARNAITVDHISRGRVAVGLGAGWHEGEHVENGFEFNDVSWRLERFREQLEIVHRQLHEDEPFDFEGRQYTLRGSHPLPRPVQQRLPIIVGGAAKRGTAEPAARFADEFNTTSASVEDCRERRQRLDQACERVGREPATLPLSLMALCVVGADAGDFQRRTRRLSARLGRPAEQLPWWPDQALVGTVDQVADRLREYEDAGVTRVMLQHLVHDDLEMVELLGREVAPAVA
jgi:alkanesulfonate monooxygenase SsuD/methylene tetrahydromethanopterin reductase-like flavin-dependent oxidoreductase (luciferase family)